MPTDQYHEPPDELGDDVRTFARVIASLQEEAEAIGWYEQRMSIETNDEARRIMEHAQREEFLHFAMDLEFLARRKEKWRVALQQILFNDGRHRRARRAGRGRGRGLAPAPRGRCSVRCAGAAGAEGYDRPDGRRPEHRRAAPARPRPGALDREAHRARLHPRPPRHRALAEPRGVERFGDLRGKRITQIVDPADVTRARQEFAAKLLGTQDSTDATVTIQAADGTSLRSRSARRSSRPGLDRRRLRAREPR